MKRIWILGPLCGLISISLLFIDESYSSKTGMAASGVCLCVCTRALVHFLCVNAQDRQFRINRKYIHAHTHNTYARTRVRVHRSLMRMWCDWMVDLQRKEGKEGVNKRDQDLDQFWSVRANRIKCTGLTR